ncbi:hypothetical protein L1987_65390 [Smallanthus sonchifolius]|uniref:Uncharacterized protein n=1 Tax=Smallanthus sonchifolius TaxID=185202 RepID=A0ACB9BU84_9ASTR|nr:hypothetical protein L1987_65390 [Smallanthus sonchifolius]
MVLWENTWLVGNKTTFITIHYYLGLGVMGFRLFRTIDLIRHCTGPYDMTGTVVSRLGMVFREETALKFFYAPLHNFASLSSFFNFQLRTPLPAALGAAAAGHRTSAPLPFSQPQTRFGPDTAFVSARPIEEQ